MGASFWGVVSGDGVLLMGHQCSQRHWGGGGSQPWWGPSAVLVAGVRGPKHCWIAEKGQGMVSFESWKN